MGTMSGPHLFSTASILPRSPEGENEEWKPSSFHSFFVSTLGRAFNTASQRLVRGTVFNSKRPILSLTTTVGGRTETRSLARLVAEAFIPVPSTLEGKNIQVKHLDGNVQNNAVSNLVWIEMNQGLDRGTDWLPSVEPLGPRQDRDGVTHSERWTRFRDSQYYVSSFGRVFSAKSMALTTPHQNELGYWRAHLSGIRTFQLHQLVAYAFNLPKKPEHDRVNHKDGDPNNNEVWNLEWATHQDNMDHASKTGLMLSGAQHPNAKLTDEQVTEVRALYDTGEWSFERLAKRFAIARRTVTRAVTGTTGYRAEHDPLEPSIEAAHAAKVEGATSFWATTSAQREEVKKKRRSIPARSTTNLLSAQTVLDVRQALASETAQVVADRFSLNLYTVMAIRDRKTYAWVTDPDSQPPKPGPKFDKPVETDRVLVTAVLVESVLKLRQDGVKLEDIANMVGLHPGTVKRIVGGRHLLQQRGQAKTADLKSRSEQVAAIVGKVTPQVIDEVLALRMAGRSLNEITKIVDLTYPTIDKVLRGDHWLQREGKASLPPVWPEKPVPVVKKVKPERPIVTSTQEPFISRSERQAQAQGKITPEMVREILALHHAGVSQGRICRSLDLGGPTVFEIVHGKHWLQREGRAPMPDATQMPVKPHIKVTIEVIATVENLRRSGKSRKAIIEAVGLSPPTVDIILRGEHTLQQRRTA